jgi:hypothetical protein
MRVRNAVGCCFGLAGCFGLFVSIGGYLLIQVSEFGHSEKMNRSL